MLSIERFPASEDSLVFSLSGNDLVTPVRITTPKKVLENPDGEQYGLSDSVSVIGIVIDNYDNLKRLAIANQYMAASSSSISFGDNLTTFTKKDLIEALKQRDLKTAGTKDVLIARLKIALKKENDEMATVQASNTELSNPEISLVKMSPGTMDAFDLSKEEDPMYSQAAFLSPDYENIDSAQGSPELDKEVYEADEGEGRGESFASPRDIAESLESITPSKEYPDNSDAYFEQIDSMSETGDPEAELQDAEYEVLSDRENSEDFTVGDESFGQDMVEFVDAETGDFLPGQTLPSESELLLYEDEPVDAEMELIDLQEDPQSEPMEFVDEKFLIEGQEPISPCDSQEEYPLVLQETSEKKETKALSTQSNEDEVVLDVGGEKLELENVGRKEKFEKYKEIKKQDPKCNLWISNLSEDTRASMLKNRFTAHGNVISAKIVANASKSGEKNKFFGYVIMSTPEEAAKCIEEMNNSEIDGKQVTVEIAKATLPNVVSRSGKIEDKEYSDRGDSANKSGRREDFQGRRIILVKGDSGQKLVRVREEPHSGNSRVHSSSARQVREVRDIRHRSASPRERRISIDRRNRFSPPPSFRGIHSNNSYRRRVISRDYPMSSRGIESKSYGSYRGRGMRHESGYSRGMYSPRMHHSMRGVGVHTPRSFDSSVDKTRRDDDKRRMVEEIRRHEKLENEIRKRDQREKERLVKQMHEREAVREKEFRERERQLHEREQSEREKRLMLEEALRNKEKRERELLKEKEMQTKVLQDRERQLAKREKEAQNMTQLQEEIIVLERKQEEEKMKLEQRLKEYQNREKRIEIEQQERHRKEMQAKERMEEAGDQERRLKESKKRFEEMPVPRQTIKRPFDESRREYPEKRVRDDPHSHFYSSEDSQRQKGSAPAHGFRGDTFGSSKRGAPHPQQSGHSSGHASRYTKQSDEYYESGESGSHSYSAHGSRPYSSRGGHSYRGRNYVPRHSDNQRSMAHSDQSRERTYESKKARDHSPQSQERYSYPRSERHSMSGGQSHKSHSGSSGMGRQSERYGERHSSGKSLHRDSSGHGLGTEWHNRSYPSAAGQQAGYLEQRPLAFDKMPRPPMPSFGLPPTPVLPGAPGGFMNPNALGHSAAAAALLTSFSLQQQSALRGQAPFQPNFHPNFRQ